MEIRAKVALSLPSIFYRVILKYDTFQSATYDSYLIASLVYNSKNKKEAIEYIDDITGKGSLNSHFKKLYDEIERFTKDQIENIIRDSVYPITIVDDKHHFKYYPMFKATRMLDRVFDGNIYDQHDLLLKLIMPKDENTKFLSIDFEIEDSRVKIDNYNAIFNETSIRVDLDNNQYYEISKEDFDQVYQNDVENLDGFLGLVGNEITDGNWNVLTKSIIGTFSKNNFRYRDSNNVHSIIFNDCIKTIEIINVFGLYFYKEAKYNFSNENSRKCEDALNYLLESKNINEIKTKTLVSLLSFVSDKTAQSVIQYIINRKDSKELSEFAIKLIKSGLEKGWEVDVLKSIKRLVSIVDYKYLYKINSDLDFLVEEILDIDDCDLTRSDKKRKEDYLSEKNNLLKDIHLWIGEITNSGIREKIKSLPKSELKSKVKKFLDKRTGHNKKEYDKMSLSELKKEHDEIKQMFICEYREILKIIKDYQENENL